MRATVSIMLSHGSTGDPTVARPDYEQTTFHHGCLLVLLRGVGPSKPRSLQKIFDKVRRVNNIKIKDSTGGTRDIWVRYIHDHPVENNDWGDFQTHRRLIGLITIGKFDSQTELNELCRHHESLKVRYSNTLYDTRAVFFGPSGESPRQANHSNHVVFNDDVVDTDAASGAPRKSTATDMANQHGSKAVAGDRPRLQDEFTTPTNFKSQAYFYREHNACDDLDGHIVEFVNNIFWVLESKRLERSREKVDKVSMLFAPFEKRDFVGLDMESRNNRKRCVGRVTKNLADLSLQAGLIEESLGLYHSACETLRAISDSLWEGAAEEGLCAASSILLYPHLREIETLHRNASLQEGSSPLRGITEKRRSSDATRRREHHNTATTPSAHVPALAQLTSASSSCSSVSSILTNSSVSGGTTSTSSSSTSTATLNQFGGHSELPGNILKPEEISIKFRRAIINYSKYRHAAIVETEAALKAARICIEQCKPLDVAMFLQNILYINLSLSEAERVKRFEVITDLYQQIGYQRKAAFFQRLAALKHVQQGNMTPDWSQSYNLMLSSFGGYLLNLDPLDVIESAAGWPSLQIDLLQSLIMAAMRLGQSALATRHMTFLLQTQWSNMAPTEQCEMAVQLQNLSAQCEGSPVPLVLDNGTVIPPANLTDLPYCMELVVKDLPAHLRPLRMKKLKADNGPFLFTPIHFSKADKKDKNKMGFFWIQNNLSEIVIRLRNPLPFELPVTDIRLLTNGIVFESLPQTVTLQPNVPNYVTLHGTPIEVGQLEIQGYSTHTLGVKSNCRLKHMKGRQFPANYLVDVIPALPFVTAKTSLPQSVSFSSTANADIVITSASLTLYNGESAECVVTVINESTLPVEYLEVLVNSNVEPELQRKVFHIDDEEVQSKLPIPPKSSIDFTVRIYAEADFICPTVSRRAASVHSSSTMNASQSAPTEGGGGALAGPHSLPYSTHSSLGQTGLQPRFGSVNSGFHSRRNDTANSSLRSNTSTSTAGNSLAALSLPPTTSATAGNPDAQHIEAQLRLKYSGGEAMLAGYCRQCAISFHLELLPSAQITSWDVLPAEIPSKFYLVLDVSNLTAQEMSLHYTDTKNILIEAKESCRVPIPVDRCSLEQVCKAREAEYAENLEKELCFRTQMLSFSDSICKLCSEHIAENVKINWTLSGTEVQGKASLHGIALTQAMTDLTTVSPLQWTVLFQNCPVQPQSEIICTAGQSAIISVTVCNQSTQSLKNLVLTIKFYQDYLNGMENYNLETRVTISGPNRIHIPLLQRNEKVHHECSVLFFTPGRFKTNIQCCSTPQATSISQQLLSRSCPVPEMAVTHNEADSHTKSLPNDISGSLSYHEHQQHVWKFIPPIEVTVVEQ